MQPYSSVLMNVTGKGKLNQEKKTTLKNVQRNLPKLKPYVAIKALLTMIIPTEVTTLNIHAAASTAALSAALLEGAITMYFLQLTTVKSLSLSFRNEIHPHPYQVQEF